MMVEMIAMLNNNDGLTLKGYAPKVYKSGYQVADYGIECRTIEEAAAAVEAMGGDCGVWYADGIYYIDHSFRVNTKREALEIGKRCNQISVLRWHDMTLIFC